MKIKDVEASRWFEYLLGSKNLATLSTWSTQKHNITYYGSITFLGLSNIEKKIVKFIKGRQIVCTFAPISS